MGLTLQDSAMGLGFRANVMAALGGGLMTLGSSISSIVTVGVVTGPKLDSY